MFASIIWWIFYTIIMVSAIVVTNLSGKYNWKTYSGRSYYQAAHDVTLLTLIIGLMIVTGSFVQYLG